MKHIAHTIFDIFTRIQYDTFSPSAFSYRDTGEPLPQYGQLLLDARHQEGAKWLDLQTLLRAHKFYYEHCPEIVSVTLNDRGMPKVHPHPEYNKIMGSSRDMQRFTTFWAPPSVIKATIQEVVSDAYDDAYQRGAGLEDGATFQSFLFQIRDALHITTYDVHKALKAVGVQSWGRPIKNKRANLTVDEQAIFETLYTEFKDFYKPTRFVQTLDGKWAADYVRPSFDASNVLTSKGLLPTHCPITGIRLNYFDGIRGIHNAVVSRKDPKKPPTKDNLFITIRITRTCIERFVEHKAFQGNTSRKNIDKISYAQALIDTYVALLKAHPTMHAGHPPVWEFFTRGDNKDLKRFALDYLPTIGLDPHASWLSSYPPSPLPSQAPPPAQNSPSRGIHDAVPRDPFPSSPALPRTGSWKAVNHGR